MECPVHLIIDLASAISFVIIKLMTPLVPPMLRVDYPWNDDGVLYVTHPINERFSLMEQPCGIN